MALSWKKLVDVLDAAQAVGLAGNAGEVEVIELSGKEGLIEAPLRQADIEPEVALGCSGGGAHGIFFCPLGYNR